MRHLSRVICLMCLLFGSRLGLAQAYAPVAADQKDLPAAPSAVQGATSAQATPGSGPSHPDKQGQEKQEKGRPERMLGNYVVNRRSAPPLTPAGKFGLFTHASLGPLSFVGTGIGAGINQATDSAPHYGQGAGAYAERYGAAFTDSVSHRFWTRLFFPVLFGEDPRYFRLGEGSFKERTRHALMEGLVCRTDKGGRSFNWSNTFGALFAGALTNAYYPERDRGLGPTMGRAGLSFASTSLMGLGSEYYPDIMKKVFHRHKKARPSDK